MFRACTVLRSRARTLNIVRGAQKSTRTSKHVENTMFKAVQGGLTHEHREGCAESTQATILDSCSVQGYGRGQRCL
eukprot:5555375-Pyramimonas_sp.AAC.1